MATFVPGQPLPGTPYVFLRRLAAGGMGVVYEVEHVRLKKRYVAKVIQDHIEDIGEALMRMEREAQVLAQIGHPNVVQIHDVGKTPENVAYFVMEKLEGLDLRQTMKQRRFARPRALEIVADVLETLDYVHERGIIHRDIKPENIFLAESAGRTTAKILDFGIAHVIDTSSQARITKGGGFIGTLYYAAPEQLQGRPAGPANDVYAAGLVLFELIAGRGPFDDDPGVGLSRCFKEAPLLADAAKDVPPALTDAVRDALAQDPSRRPRAGVLAKKLRAIAAELSTQPGANEDEEIRADIDDLLDNMVPPTPMATDIAVAPTLASPAVEGALALETSPGIYSTVNPKLPLRGPSKRTGYIAAGLIVLFGVVTSTAILVFTPRMRARSAAAASAAASAASASAAPTGAAATASSVGASSSSVAAGSATGAGAAAAGNGTSGDVATAVASAPSPPGATGAPLGQGASPRAPSNAPNQRPVTARPRPASSAHGAEKDGYVKDL